MTSRNVQQNAGCLEAAQQAPKIQVSYAVRLTLLSTPSQGKS